MIKVIIEYILKNSADIQPILRKLRSHAMTFPGFISAENLRNEKDGSIVVMIQTWEIIENWRAWEPSKIRQSILQEAKPLLAEDLRTTVYRVMPATGWVYTPCQS